jgi:hypothetical protein
VKKDVQLLKSSAIRLQAVTGIRNDFKKVFAQSKIRIIDFFQSKPETSTQILLFPLTNEILFLISAISFNTL